jgi:translation initiation factor IF-2
LVSLLCFFCFLLDLSLCLSRSLFAAEGAENILLEPDVIELIAMEFGLESIRENTILKRNGDEILRDSRHNSSYELFPRAPIVAIMGHVDHGKTTLMDTLRRESMNQTTNNRNLSSTAPVAPTEAGGITQKLSAFEIELKSQEEEDGRTMTEGGFTGTRKVVFLDTPGHAAFSSMRKNGSLATDIAVIMIALDDGLRPQTIEAIRIAQKHECVIMIVLNKIDKFPQPNERQVMRRKIMTSLVEYDVLAEDLGGDIQVVEVSGKTGEGLESFLEKLYLQADLLELKSAHEGVCEGVLLDTKMMKGRGIVADLLIRWGTLRVGDSFVVNTVYGKVKSMENTAGKMIREAGPSSVIKLLGMKSIPTSGYELLGVENETKARKIAERREKIELLRLAGEKQRAHQEVEDRAAAAAVGGGEGSSGGGSVVTIPVILKSESANGLSALQHILDGIQKRLQGVSVLVVSTGIGTINQSDINLASMSQDKGERATVIGFNVPSPLPAVRSLAKENDVEIYTNEVLYRLEEALEEVIKEHMPEERVLTVEVRLLHHLNLSLFSSLSLSLLISSCPLSPLISPLSYHRAQQRFFNSSHTNSKVKLSKLLVSV